MKTHAIIPIFIPHEGCPHSCIFCNQNIITAKAEPVTASDAAGVIEAWLATLGRRGLTSVGAAFYGGSFTGLPKERQSEYLEAARYYKDRGLISEIRLSTRPDYIDDEILSNLKRHGVDAVELGVQSFDDDVLARSNRCHDSECARKSSLMVRDYGFRLGIQLMIGLPADTEEKDIFSAVELVRLKPEDARLYPAVVLPGTGLERMHAAGEYTPLALEEAVRVTKKMYKIISSAGVNIIRVGLKNYIHPAFRQLVESEIARDELEGQLDPVPGSFVFACNGKSFSNMVGHKGANKAYFKAKYPLHKISYAVDDAQRDGRYTVTR